MSVLILGARSDIGMAIAQAFAAEGHSVMLAARNAASLEADQTDIGLRHSVEVSLHDYDALDYDSHDAFLDSLPELPDFAVCAVGYMGDQDENERDMGAARLVMRSNFEGPANILALLANRMEERGNGTIIGISSVAGDRGRATNYVYGAGKAGFTAFSVWPAQQVGAQGRACANGQARFRCHQDDRRDGPAGQADRRSDQARAGGGARGTRAAQRHLCQT